MILAEVYQSMVDVQPRRFNSSEEIPCPKLLFDVSSVHTVWCNTSQLHLHKNTCYNVCVCVRVCTVSIDSRDIFAFGFIVSFHPSRHYRLLASKKHPFSFFDMYAFFDDTNKTNKLN